MEHAAQGDGGVAITRSVQEMTDCGTQSCGSVDMAVFGQRLDSMIPEVFSNLNGSVILSNSALLGSCQETWVHAKWKDIRRNIFRMLRITDLHFSPLC